MTMTAENCPFNTKGDTNKYDSLGPHSSCGDDSEEYTFTMQEAIDSLGFGWYQIRISLLAGLCFMAESMEVMMLSIIAPALHCSFYLDSVHQALLTTVVFLGMAFSANFWGLVSDKYGRKKELLLCSLVVGYFGLLSSQSPSYLWILLLRFLVGCGLGGAPQCMTYYSEFLPNKFRGPCMIAISALFAMGSCLEVSLALFVMPDLGWRWLFALSTVPVFLFALTFKILPESPRYHLTHGNSKEVMSILEKIARENRSVMPKGTLHDPTLLKGVDNGNLGDLFAPGMRKTIILLSIIWITGNVSYFGTALLTTSLFEISDDCHGYAKKPQTELESCQSFCTGLTTSDYLDLLITSVGDLPGTLIGVLTLSVVGRKKMLCAMFLIYGFVMLLCNICASRDVLVVLLFIARGSANAGSQALFVYTAEIFPTTVRATGQGWCIGVSRIGVILMPFISQSLIKESPFWAITIQGAIGLIGAIATMCLSVETANRDMKDTLNDNGIETESNPKDVKSCH